MLPSRVPLLRLLRINRVPARKVHVSPPSWTFLHGLPAANRDIHGDSPPTVPALTSSYVRGTSSSPFVLHTVGEVLQRTVERFPDREALVFVEQGVRKTFEQFQRDVDCVATGLLAIGLTKGDRLCVWGPNSYGWVLMQFATAKAGIILVCMNSAFQTQEADYVLRKVQCKAVVCPAHFKTHDYCDVLRRICPEIESSSPGNIRSSRLPDLRSVVVLDDRPPGMFSLEEVMQLGTSRHLQQLRDQQRNLSCDDPIKILFTSGTTGFPKAVTLSHFNVINNSNLFGIRSEYDRRSDVRIGIPVPMFHCFGAVLAGITMAVHGASLVFPSAEYKLKVLLDTLQDERCTILFGTPTIFVDIINYQHLNKYDLSSVYGGVIGGSPCAPELMKDIIFTLGIKEISIGYGCTELSPCAFSNHPKDSQERRTQTVGYILPHTEAKIVNPSTGEVAPLGETGDIMVRGYCVMQGYWGDEDKAEESVSEDGWYRTGDSGSLDAYGYLQIKGRAKDLIIRGGENIYPAEIEKTLHTHPKVQEAQVVGVEDFRMGEEICAFIKLGDGQDSAVQEIRDYCRGKIASYKIPRYVLFVNRFPISSSGKILKSELRKQAEKMLGMKKP
uniref:Medium-chain acyl-CoA ligase ACSF2, mitochondrial n=2 Tax=Takifugu rubripes TaxID=31033 RepID=A0A3B5K1A9_TAKRU